MFSYWIWFQQALKIRQGDPQSYVEAKAGVAGACLAEALELDRQSEDEVGQDVASRVARCAVVKAANLA